MVDPWPLPPPLSLPAALSLSLTFLFHRNPSRSRRRRLGRRELRRAPSLVVPSPPCRIEPACGRNRARSPCIALAVAVFFSDPDELQHRFWPPCTSSVPAELAHASRVRLRTPPYVFPSPPRPRTVVRRNRSSAIVSSSPALIPCLPGSGAASSWLCSSSSACVYEESRRGVRYRV